MVELGIDISQLMQPLIIKSIFSGEEIPIDALVDAMLTQKIYESIKGSLTLPPEFKDLESVLDLMIQMDSIKRVLAVLRGETPPPPAIDKVIELVVNLQMINALSQAFGTVAS